MWADTLVFYSRTQGEELSLMRLIDPLLAVPARPLLAGIDMSQPDFKCKPVFCVKKLITCIARHL